MEALVVGAQQRVEILKALAHDARVLILDEPTAVLTPLEARDLLERTRDFTRRGGTAILITHKLREAIAFADDVTVLRRGRVGWSGSAEEATEASLVTAMVGGAVKSGGRDRASTSPGIPVIVLENVRATDERGVERLRGVSLTVRESEIVGIAAVEGNGQRELLRVAAGRMRPASGRATLPAGRVGFVPEDRKRDAIIADMSLVENVALAGGGERRGRMNWTSERGRTRSMIGAYDIRTTGPDAKASTLSGGNQQKLVLGRELGSGRSLVVENPSRGLDVQAAAAVHAALREARAAGGAVLVYSSDLDEVLALADRIIVMNDGVAREVSRDRDEIGQAMLGGE